MNQPRSTEKPFAISKQAVWEAFRKVKANQGAPGVDGQTIEEFEADLRNNLYRVWNRMSSGSYFPPPVWAVEIAKPHGGGVRMLGVPTVADRVAQTVVAMELEKAVEPKFHRDSYGYRPGRSPLDAVAACRRRCFTAPWVVDLDVEKFFDSVPWHLIVKAVEANTGQKWVLLYVERWLKAPVQHPDGTLERRDRGTPQGSPVSPLLANLFMHYGFDLWMVREFPTIPFERFCDDVVVHCVSEKQARYVRERTAARLGELGLRLHPDKTRTGRTLNELAAWVNQIVPGWVRYYGRYYPSLLRPLLRRINAYILRWARNKYRRLRSFKKALAWWNGVVRRDPTLLTHWQWMTNLWMTG